MRQTLLQALALRQKCQPTVMSRRKVMEYGSPADAVAPVARLADATRKLVEDSQGLDIGHVPNNHRHGAPGGDESARQDHPVDLIKAFPKVNSGNGRWGASAQSVLDTERET
eukprot:13881134-Alexandrium_andersonii.AAC.1